MVFKRVFKRSRTLILYKIKFKNPNQKIFLKYAIS